MLASVSAESHLRREDEGERGPLAEDAVALDVSAVRLDDLLRDGEPEPGARHRSRSLIVRLIELLEDVRQLLRRDPGARVTHLDLHVMVRWGRGQLHGAARWSELEGVREQVAHDFVDAIGIPLYFLGKPIAHRDPELDAALYGQHVEGALELVEQGGEMDRARLDAPAARLESRHVQQLSGQPRERAPLRLDRREDLGLFARERSVYAVLHELKVAQDDVDRRLQLVGCDRHELRLQLVELGQL